jgi:hypothetical protein
MGTRAKSRRSAVIVICWAPLDSIRSWLFCALVRFAVAARWLIRGNIKAPGFPVPEPFEGSNRTGGGGSHGRDPRWLRAWIDVGCPFAHRLGWTGSAPSEPEGGDHRVHRCVVGVTEQRQVQELLGSLQ